MTIRKATKKKFEETTLKEVGKLDEIHLRVVENAKGKFIDVREWVISDTYTGWSKKGVRFRADQAGTLLRLIADACVVVDEGDVIGHLAELVHDDTLKGALVYSNVNPDGCAGSL